VICEFLETRTQSMEYRLRMEKGATMILVLASVIA